MALDTPAVDMDLVQEALLWAWTNATGRLPDRGTMTEAEIKQYWVDYRAILRRAIRQFPCGEPN